MENKIYNLEDRLIRFAGETIYYCKTLPNDSTGNYYGNQVLRSSGGAALNYGEAQGTVTTKDFIHKMSIVLKELRESKISLKVLEYVKYGDDKKREYLIQESAELAAISAKMILNKKNKNS